MLKELKNWICAVPLLITCIVLYFLLFICLSAMGLKEFEEVG